MNTTGLSLIGLKLHGTTSFTNCFDIALVQLVIKTPKKLVSDSRSSVLTVGCFCDVARLTASDQLVPSVATVCVSLVAGKTGCTGGVTRPTSCWWLRGRCGGVVHVVGIFVAVVGRTVARPCCGIDVITASR